MDDVALKECGCFVCERDFLFLPGCNAFRFFVLEAYSLVNTLFSVSISVTVLNIKKELERFTSP